MRVFLKRLVRLRAEPPYSRMNLGGLYSKLDFRKSGYVSDFTIECVHSCLRFRRAFFCALLFWQYYIALPAVMRFSGSSTGFLRPVLGILASSRSVSADIAASRSSRLALCLKKLLLQLSPQNGIMLGEGSRFSITGWLF